MVNVLGPLYSSSSGPFSSTISDGINTVQNLNDAPIEAFPDYCTALDFTGPDDHDELSQSSDCDSRDSDLFSDSAYELSDPGDQDDDDYYNNDKPDCENERQDSI